MGAIAHFDFSKLVFFLEFAQDAISWVIFMIFANELSFFCFFKVILKVPTLFFWAILLLGFSHFELSKLVFFLRCLFCIQFLWITFQIYANGLSVCVVFYLGILKKHVGRIQYLMLRKCRFLQSLKYRFKVLLTKENRFNSWKHPWLVPVHKIHLNRCWHFSAASLQNILHLEKYKFFDTSIYLFIHIR